MTHLSMQSQKKYSIRALNDHYDRKKPDALDKAISTFEKGHLHEAYVSTFIAHLKKHQIERVLNSPHVGPKCLMRIVGESRNSSELKDSVNKIVNTPHLFNKLDDLGTQYLSHHPEHHDAILAGDPKKITNMAGQRMTEHAQHLLVSSSTEHSQRKISNIFHVLKHDTDTHATALGRIMAFATRNKMDILPEDQLK